MNSYIIEIIYCCEPFDRYHAFCDLQNLAKHNNGRVIVPERVLASRWMWSLGKVRRYIDDLHEHGVIIVTKASKQNIITIVEDQPANQLTSDKEQRARAFCDLVTTEYPNINSGVLDSFISYWLEWSPRVNKFRFELSENFDLDEKLSFWVDKAEKFNNKLNTNHNGKHSRKNGAGYTARDDDEAITIEELQQPIATTPTTNGHSR